MVYKEDKEVQKNLTDHIYYVGVNDKNIDLFEGQYIVPDGVSYNSYIIKDEKIAIMDTVDARAGEEWLNNVEKVLEGKSPDYLIVSHLEPDHGASIKKIAEVYPDMKLVMNAKAYSMLPNFFDISLEDRCIQVKEGDTLEIGEHCLTFIMAPMVHWPEVMVAYEQKDKVLFSADGFGKFGALEATEEDLPEGWTCEARRYYFNIVGKYGIPVQNLLKKASSLDIQMICPLHGPVLTENLDYYIGKYQVWSSYEVEDEGVLIAYSSMHGNTKEAAELFGKMLTEQGAAKVAISDLAREDMAEIVEDAFRYSHLVVAAPTYDGGIMPVMMDFLHHLKVKAYQNRKVAIIENASWAPAAGKIMKEMFAEMKKITIVEDIVSITSTVKEKDMEAMAQMAKELIG